MKGEKKTMEKQIKSSNWLIKGYTEQELAEIKEKAIKEAEAELRDKQIEEMAKVLGEIQEFGINRPRDEERYPVLYPSNKEVADYLVSKDYRKASDVAREIFAEIKYLIWQNDTHPAGELTERIAPLKKKYESEDR